MEQTKEKKYIVGSIICGLLTAFGIVAATISLIDADNTAMDLCNCFYIIILFCTFFYAFVGYKKPHGNLLKYVILFNAVSLIPSIIFCATAEATVDIILLVLEVGVLCYVAGRLAKVKENLVLMLIVTVCELIFFISAVASGNVYIGNASPLIIWLDICVAYFLRYKEHKEAGLMDAPKK